ncbi:hypothetical protein BS50DRAFT_635816 [Corynespora cassiicola Philippines]|uniref:Uncharacterized protein n=1 Tax=Corynespora cassiicola Philippines TaxID=1448308 RepID=A0A2T2NI93_CORCC|nr:hypothetical protein BS50DRAFT_635816 [Corynespora cassiicola Philippines]
MYSPPYPQRHTLATPEPRPWIRGANLRGRFTVAGRNGSRHLVEVAFLDRRDDRIDGLGAWRSSSSESYNTYPGSSLRSVMGESESESDDEEAGGSEEDEGSSGSERALEVKKVGVRFALSGEGEVVSEEEKKKKKEIEARGKRRWTFAEGVEWVEARGDGVRGCLAILLAFQQLINDPLIYLVPNILLVVTTLGLPFASQPRPAFFFALEVLILMVARPLRGAWLDPLYGYLVLAYLLRYEGALPGRVGRSTLNWIQRALRRFGAVTELGADLYVTLWWGIPGLFNEDTCWLWRDTFAGLLMIFGFWWSKEEQEGGEMVQQLRLETKDDHNDPKPRQGVLSSKLSPADLYVYDASTPPHLVARRFWGEALEDTFLRVVPQIRLLLGLYLTVYLTYMILRLTCHLGPIKNCQVYPTIREIGLWSWLDNREAEFLEWTRSALILQAWAPMLIQSILDFFVGAGVVGVVYLREGRGLLLKDIVMSAWMVSSGMPAVLARKLMAFLEGALSKIATLMKHIGVLMWNMAGEAQALSTRGTSSMTQIMLSMFEEVFGLMNFWIRSTCMLAAGPLVAIWTWIQDA